MNPFEITILITAVLGLFIAWHYVSHKIDVNTKMTAAELEHIKAKTENVQADTATINATRPKTT